MSVPWVPDERWSVHCTDSTVVCSRAGGVFRSEERVELSYDSITGVRQTWSRTSPLFGYGGLAFVVGVFELVQRGVSISGTGDWIIPLSPSVLALLLTVGGAVVACIGFTERQMIVETDGGRSISFPANATDPEELVLLFDRCETSSSDH
jgi:hypothetical protein